MALNALHPALDPVTEYVVVKLGVTAKDWELDPVLQVYVDAPLTVIEEFPPAHKDGELAFKTKIIVDGPTATLVVCVSLHPKLVPVTV